MKQRESRALKMYKFSPHNRYCSPVSTVKWIKPEGASKMLCRGDWEMKGIYSDTEGDNNKVVFLSNEVFFWVQWTLDVAPTAMPYLRPQYHILTEARGKADLGTPGSNTASGEEWKNKGSSSRTCKIIHNNIAGKLVSCFSSESLKYFL